ncbi:hypothetical protein TA3x_004221 [Tundrisphaera sp. TA3]|uniref:hypothetical protein n=1 Tax=Tundrisphaera sp. TA3 TaxID=3435775 RepID=UPI003EB76EA4
MGDAWGTWPIVRPVAAWRPWLLAAIYAGALLPLTYLPRHSGNVFSRYMAIEAMVERGELAVERSPLLIPSGTPDLVMFGPHLYSDKPPVLPAIAAPLYAVLYGCGLRFAGRGNAFVWANLAMTWGVAGLISACGVAWARRLFQAVPIAPWVSDLLALALGFGTQMLTYAVTFNNHSVGAAALIGAFAFAVLEPAGEARHRARFGSGLLAGLAATVDLPAGCWMLAGLGLIQAIRVRSVPWAFLLGALGPLALHCVLQSRVTGTPLPAEMYPEAFNYPGSYWATPEGTWKERGPRGWFALELLVGPQGWLTVTPVLVVGLVGVAAAMARRGDPMRPAAWLVGSSAVVLVAYYTWGVRRLDFAGASFGTRHLLAISPLVYVFAVVAASRLRAWWAVALMAPLLAVGFVYAYAGMKDPWSRIEKREATEPALRALQRFTPYRPSGDRRP